MKKKSKADAIKIVVACAKKYSEELCNKDLMIVYVDKYKKVYSTVLSFFSWNYLHLTGLQRGRNLLTAQQFYDSCLSHKLSPDDIEFSDDGTTELKLDVLPSIICKNLKATMLGTYNNCNPILMTEKIAGGVNACIGFVLNDGCGPYVPNTLLKGNIKDYTYETFRIIAIFRKNITDNEFCEVTYLAKKVEWKKLFFSFDLQNIKEKIFRTLDLAQA